MTATERAHALKPGQRFGYGYYSNLGGEGYRRGTMRYWRTEAGELFLRSDGHSKDCDGYASWENLLLWSPVNRTWVHQGGHDHHPTWEE